MRHAVLTLCVCFLAGCSGESGQTIEGKVTFADGKPLGQGYVVLSDGAHSYNGFINPDGTYKAENVLKGDYKVGFGGVTLGGKTAEVPGAVEGMAYDAKGIYIQPPPPLPSVSLLKESLCNPETSGLTVKVPSESYDISVQAP